MKEDLVIHSHRNFDNTESNQKVRDHNAERNIISAVISLDSA
jgi:hypothetical protein